MIKFTAVPVTLDAAAGEDAPRTITGIAVPWDTVATVSGGEKVMFKRGAFDLNAKPARLLENHDGRPSASSTNLSTLTTVSDSQHHSLVQKQPTTLLN